MQEKLSQVSKYRILAFLGQFDQESWTPESSSEWADFCICSQMAGSSLNRAYSVWSPRHSVFIGACSERYMEKGEPAVSLLDVFMGVLFGSFTPRIQEEHPILLKSCLIQPNLEESFPVILEKTY